MAERATVDVDLGEWKKGSRGVILRAQTVSIGVFVALSNITTGNGYLGFFTADSVLQFEGMVRTARRERGAQSVALWLGGAALIAPRFEDAAATNAETLQLRGRVNHVLDRSGFRLMRSRWLETGKCLNVALDCGTRSLVLRILNDPAHPA